MLSFFGHAISGMAHNHEQRVRGQATVSVIQYVGTSRFWFDYVPELAERIFSGRGVDRVIHLVAGERVAGVEVALQLCEG